MHLVISFSSLSAIANAPSGHEEKAGALSTFPKAEELALQLHTVLDHLK